MTAKEYLSEIQRLKCDLKFYEEMCRNCHIEYDSMRGMDYTAPKVQTSPRNALEEAAWRMFEDQEGYRRQIIDISRELNKRLSMMQHLPNPLYSRVLYLTFYEGLDARETAARLKKKPGTVANLRSEALRAFQKKYLSA